MSKSVEEYLNEADYSFDDYIPSKAALEFITFIKLVNGSDGEENKTPVVHYKLLDEIFNRKKRLAVMCHRGFGKLETEDSPILTTKGWSTMGEVQVGDEVVDRNGKGTLINYKTEAQYPETYLMTLTDGTTMEVGDEHKHIVWLDRRTPKAKRNTERVMTTTELLVKGLTKHNKKRTQKNSKVYYKFGIPLVEPVEFSYKELSIAPYMMGIGLANGYFPNGQISCHADDMLEIGRYLSDIGYNCNSMRICGDNAGHLNFGRAVFKEYKELRSSTKYIPSDYFIASIKQRLDLLRGLMDGDGTISKNGSCSYSSSNKQLSENVRDLARSLGAISYIKEYSRCGKIEYRTTINIKMNPFKLKRKADKWKPTKKMTKGIVSLEPLGKKKGYCIQVDSSTHSYISNGYTVTHNTTLIAEYLFMYIAVYGRLPNFGDVNLALYVADSAEGGAKNLRKNIEFRYNKSEFMQKYVPNIRFTDTRLEFENTEGHTLIVKMFGGQSNIRGTKEQGTRPQLVVMDDLYSDQDAKSPTVIENIDNNIYKAVGKALHPKNSKMILIGTPFNTRESLYRAVESGAWNVAVYPICEQFPCEKKDFKGSWEDRFPYEYVKDEYDMAVKSGMVQAFNQELMLRIMSDEDRLVQDDDIVWYDSTTLLQNKSNYNFYITTDFATSEKTSSDFSVISVWAYNNNGDWLWVDGTVKRQLMNNNIDDVFRFVSMYKPQSVGVEVTGQQGGFVQWLQNEMINRNIFFNLASDSNSNKPGIRPNTNKMTRFMTVLPLFKQKKIWFPKDKETSVQVAEAMNEIRNAAVSGFKSKHDDFIDTVSMLSVMNPWKPSEQQIDVNKSDDGVWKTDYIEENIDTSYDIM